MGDSRYRALPSLDRLLRLGSAKALLQGHRREAVVRLLRTELDAARAGISRGEPAPKPEAIVAAAASRADRDWVARPTRLINATGVILHTAAGRAPLSADAIAAMQQVAGYCDLELELKTGNRSSRQDEIRAKILALTGADGAHVT